MVPISLTDRQKITTVLKRNTFFFNYNEFEEKWEAYTSSVTNLLLLLKNELEGKKAIQEKKKIVTDFIYEKQDGFTAILALMSISEEFMLRLITFLRNVDDKDLNKLVNKTRFPQTPNNKEWNKKYLFRAVRTNKSLTEGLVNLLFEGFSVPILRESLPLFELKKLNFNKLDFSTESLLDSIIRLAKKGSYKASRENDPAGLLKRYLAQNNISYKSNTIVPNIRRKVDFTIPTEDDPKVIIESSYEVTTSSAMGDKAKTEIEVATDIRRHYPRTAFIGFIDGVGWYIRKTDLERLVSAFDDVFTFKQIELERFRQYLSHIL
jgi:hypothetical protein